MSEWKEVELGDFLTFQRGFDIVKRDMKEEGLYDVIFSSGFGGKHNEFKVKAPGVIVGRKGTLGSVFYSDTDFWPTDTTLWVKDFHGNDPRFAYYFLATLKFEQYDCGSANPTLNRNHIHTLEINVPESPQEQANIAAVLSCLDRKIENLRRQNETLERIAQTQFKHWFVDFEFPNEDGKPYKSSGGAMVRSELGEIPEGWHVVRMEEIADRIAMGPFGSRITTDNFVDSGVPVIRGGNLVNGFNEREFVYLTEEKADELKSSNAFPEDIVFTHRGTLGQVGFIPTHSQYSRYVVSQSQMLLGVNKYLASPRFVYRFFCTQVGMNAILINTNTTGVPSIGRPTTTLKSIQIALPEEKVMHQFDSLIKAIDFKREANDKQIRTLTKTRDILIPKLMSGQLRIIE